MTYGGVALAGGLVEERQVLAGVLAVGGEVVVGAVGDALELTPRVAGEPELVLDVDGPLGVVRQLLLGGVVVESQVLRIDAQVDVPVETLIDPVLVPLFVLARLDEELHLHLLEFAGAEDEVARCDLVAEALADLRDAERRLLARGGHHVLEVHEDALRGLRTEVMQTLFVVDGGAEEGLHQPAERLGLGPVAGLAGLRVVDVGEAVLRRVPVLGLVGSIR